MPSSRAAPFSGSTSLSIAPCSSMMHQVGGSPSAEDCCTVMQTMASCRCPAAGAHPKHDCCLHQVWLAQMIETDSYTRSATTCGYCIPHNFNCTSEHFQILTHKDDCMWRLNVWRWRQYAQ